MELLLKYFPELDQQQLAQFGQLGYLYSFWNEHVNVIARPDIQNLYERHVLHSLAIAKVCPFVPGTSVVDVGTGGGFPGIPLAIMFPDARFHLIDSIGKKVKVVDTVATALGLQNVRIQQLRAEELTDTYDFMVSRAVTLAETQVRWASGIIHSEDRNDLPNGLLLLKGGDLTDELRTVKQAHYSFPISDFFDEPWFEHKQVLYIAM
jgi:16S rRNA (guanine527-N7)-methyltransferase